MTLLTSIESKDWILLLIGSGFPIAISIARILTVFYNKYKQITPIIGEWHYYHFSRANFEPVFRHTVATIKRTIKGVKITVKDSDNVCLPYIGKIDFEGNTIIINAKGVKHNEIWHARFYDSVPNTNTRMIGIEAAQDFDREVYAAVVVLSRREISFDQAREILSKFTQISRDEFCLRINRTKVAEKI
jgi:hypothetical protein